MLTHAPVLARLRYMWRVLRCAAPRRLRNRALLRDAAFQRLLAEAITRDNAAFDNSSHVRAEPHFCLYTHSLAPGGAERQWCLLALALADKGHYVTLLVDTLRQGGDHWRFLLDNSAVRLLSLEEWPLEVPENPSSAIPPVVQRLMRVFTVLSPTHVLCQLDATNIRGAAAALLADTHAIRRILVSFRNVNPSHFPRIHWPYMRPLYTLLATSKRVLLTGNSAYGNEDYAKWLGIDRTRVARIPNIIDLPPAATPEERMEARAALNIPLNARVVLGAFRLATEKNPRLFFEVIRRLRASVPDVLAIHAGGGALRGPARRLADMLCRQGKLRLLGVRGDIDVLMRATDVLLLTSDMEGLPNVLLEAQAYGLPVVATRVGGAPEAVVEDTTAFLAPRGDGPALAAHCERLLRDTALREKTGGEGRKFVKKTFSRHMTTSLFFGILGISQQEQHR